MNRLFLFYPLFSEIAGDQGGDEACGAADAVGDAVQGAGVVGRQVLVVLQVGDGGRPVDAQRGSDHQDADQRVAADVREQHQQQAGNEVS